MALHDLGETELCTKESCHKLAWTLDACLKVGVARHGPRVLRHAAEREAARQDGWAEWSSRLLRGACLLRCSACLPRPALPRHAGLPTLTKHCVTHSIVSGCLPVPPMVLPQDRKLDQRRLRELANIFQPCEPCGPGPCTAQVPSACLCCILLSGSPQPATQPAGLSAGRRPPAAAIPLPPASRSQTRRQRRGWHGREPPTAAAPASPSECRPTVRGRLGGSGCFWHAAAAAPAAAAAAAPAAVLRLLLLLLLMLMRLDAPSPGPRFHPQPHRHPQLATATSTTPPRTSHLTPHTHTHMRAHHSPAPPAALLPFETNKN